MPKLLLVDGSNYLFRAFHALPPLTTSKGEPTGAIKGFNGMLRTVHDTVSPDCEICVFDAKGKNFRHELFESYKANRPPMPEELRSQIEPIFELVRLQGWPLLQVEGVEADDVLGTLAVQAVVVGWDVVIATGDKDLAQLVSDHIHLINTMTKTVLDREGVFEKYGVYPECVIDYLALMGDKVDNVPGINKCGPKTAAKWIAEYGCLDNLVANADQVKGKIGEYLREGIPFLDLAKKLVTINTQAQLYSLYVKDALTAIYNRHGFYDELRNRIAKLAGKRKMLFMASVDLDQLKLINDHYGHIEGDFAIRSIAQAISDTAVEVDGICARFGGDEYVMCLVEEYDKANLTFYEKYRQMLQEEENMLVRLIFGMNLLILRLERSQEK